MLNCVHGALLASDLDTLTEYLVANMPKLVDTEIGGYNEADTGRGRFRCLLLAIPGLLA